ncbi:MAG: hypothetical protein ACOYLE_12005 [Bacteroidales bacterium]|jgi:hypothetical protein
MSNIFYAEEQKVNNRWLWLLLATITIVFLYGFAEQLILKHPQATNSASNWAMFFIGLLSFGALYLIYSIKFSFQIDEEGIKYRFSPFHITERIIQWDDITTLYVRKYKPIAEYGGWGIRTLSFKKNIAYNISGNYGLQIELKNGKKILFGTQNPEELEKIITHFYNLSE